MGLFGPPNVEKMKAKGDVPGLIEALDYEKDNGSTRGKAVVALGEVGDARAVEPLLQLSHFWNYDFSCLAAVALAKIDAARAVEPLVTILVGIAPINMEDSTYKAAEAALAKIGLPAVEPLIALFRNRDYTFEESNVRKALIAVLVRIGAPAVGPLASVLGDKDYHVNDAAVDALGEIGSPAVEPLIAVLRGKGNERHRSAARALGKTKDDRAVEPLTEALHRYREIAGTAASALGNIGSPPARDALFAAFQSRASEVRDAAMSALEKTGDARAAEPLIDKAEQLIAEIKGDDPAARSKAESALAYLGAPVVETLIAALDDEDERVRRAAVDALGESKDSRAVEPLIAMFNQRYKEPVCLALKDALKSLYRSGRLDPASKEKILAAPKKQISYSHEQDGCTKHIDYWIEIEI